MGYNCYRQETRRKYNDVVEVYNDLLFNRYWRNPLKWQTSLRSAAELVNRYNNESATVRYIPYGDYEQWALIEKLNDDHFAWFKE